MNQKVKHRKILNYTRIKCNWILNTSGLRKNIWGYILCEKIQMKRLIDFKSKNMQSFSVRKTSEQQKRNEETRNLSRS